MQGCNEHVCKISRSKRRGHLDVCAVKCKLTAWHRYLVLVYTRFRAIKFYKLLVLRSQFFEYLRENLYKHTLEHLEATRQEKKAVIFLLPAVNTNIDLF